jgi:hypothetical protein
MRTRRVAATYCLQNQSTRSIGNRYAAKSIPNNADYREDTATRLHREAGPLTPAPITGPVFFTGTQPDHAWVRDSLRWIDSTISFPISAASTYGQIGWIHLPR